MDPIDEQRLGVLVATLVLMNMILGFFFFFLVSDLGLWRFILAFRSGFQVYHGWVGLDGLGFGFF